MQSQTKLAQITHHFYNCEYEEGKKELTQLIETDPNNSMLLSNRALFWSQLGHNPQAQNDLQTALSKNPLNYIAYFNLFSIQTQNNDDAIAYQNLCCSLSCLHLIKAKQTKAIEDVNKAIVYAHNNLQAHVLKGLILMQNQNYLDAVKQFQEAEKIDGSNKVLRILKRVAISKAHPQLEEEHEQQNDNSNEIVDRRLKSSLVLNDSDDLVVEINKKVSEFNELYTYINSEAGAITRKIPKDSVISNNIETFIKQKSVLNQSNKDADIAIIEDAGQKTPAVGSEVHPEPGGYYILSSLSDRPYQIEQCVKEQNHFEHFQSILSSQNQMDQVKQSQFKSIINSEHQDAVLNEFQSVIHYTEAESSHKSLDIASQKCSLGSGSIQQNHNIGSYNLIYPLDQNMKLKINVINMTFIEKPEEQLNKLTDVYCIINYNGGASKLKTATKKCQEEICFWNQQFQPIDLSNQPSDMKIKVYNKKYNSVRDEFLGDLQVLITSADLLKLPVHSKKGDFLGNLLIHLQLVEILPKQSQPTPEQQNEE